MLRAGQIQGISSRWKPAEQTYNAAFGCRFNLTTFSFKIEKMDAYVILTVTDHNN